MLQIQNIIFLKDSAKIEEIVSLWLCVFVNFMKGVGHELL